LPGRRTAWLDAVSKMSCCWLTTSLRTPISPVADSGSDGISHFHLFPNNDPSSHPGVSRRLFRAGVPQRSFARRKAAGRLTESLLALLQPIAICLLSIRGCQDLCERLASASEPQLHAATAKVRGSLFRVQDLLIEPRTGVGRTSFVPSFPFLSNLNHHHPPQHTSHS
jgi:hypothetical protein